MFKSPPQRYSQYREFEVQFDPVDSMTYPSNFIKTSRYNVITFLPLSLLGQFRRYANIYFLFIAIIQSIPTISPLNPISAIAPLVFVLGLSMIREAIEDIGRHASDREVNAMDCSRYSKGKCVPTSWADVQVGQILIVKQDEMFATDLIVLGSVFESGVCYIETSSLDGEKNLKPKSAIKETQQLFNKLEFPNMKLLCGAASPNPSLGDFEGAITLPNGTKKVLNGKQLLLRGAFLRNTKWIIGAVAYTGEDTKVMRNAEPGRIKQSTVEMQMNRLILCILLVQCCSCLVSAVLQAWWNHNMGPKHTYVWQSSWDPDIYALIGFFSYFLLYNTMIPISLVVSMEFVKVFQSYFIETDQDMYVAKRDKYAKAQTSTINEELGQVEYVFSDKTGTLTCNQMEFKYCIIGDTLYGNGKPAPPQQTGDPTKFQHSVFTFKDETLEGIIANHPNQFEMAQHKRNYIVPSHDNATQLNFATQAHLIHEYFMLLASAHECLAQHEDGHITYQGPSPDEITLVDAAMHMGFIFEGQSSSSQNFKILGQPKQIELLYQFEFDSARKRMSSIVRDEGKYKLYIKGADNIITKRLAVNQPYLPYIETKLSEFSSIGLRTLLMAMRVLSDQEFEAFDKAMQALAQSDQPEQERASLADNLEKELYLLGATAVEDKLQDLVPETIADLLKANIKVWMLTGDKLETAENIARSCRLIQGDFTVMRFAETNENALRQKLFDNKETYYMCIKDKKKKSFLVEGDALTLIFDNPQLKREFLKMAPNCDSVVCCRVTPKQKAQVVKLIKDNLNKVTLAIGDGANDVNMIQEAHIGVGLYGNEGMRAVQSADFALGEFRCLWRLLLVHGHWSYIRIAEMILYFFYKNMIFTVPQFLFSFFSAYSAQTYFDDWYITFYNLIFTSLPLIARATFDRDVYYKVRCKQEGNRELYQRSENYVKGKFPLLYYVGQKQTIFTAPNFIFWWGQGFVHGLLVYFLTMGCFDTEVVTSEGHVAGFAPISITAYTAIIFIVDLKIALYTKFWTWLSFVTMIFLSIALYVAYFFISNYFIGSYSEYTPIYLIQSPTFYLVILFLNAVVFIFDVTLNAVLHEFYATESDHIHDWRGKFKSVAKNKDAIRRIEMQQLEKREQGMRGWGDSFYEAILEERLQSDREHNKQLDEHELNGALEQQKIVPVTLPIESPKDKKELHNVPKKFDVYVR